MNQQNSRDRSERLQQTMNLLIAVTGQQRRRQRYYYGASSQSFRLTPMLVTSLILILTSLRLGPLRTTHGFSVSSRLPQRRQQLQQPNVNLHDDNHRDGSLLLSFQTPHSRSSSFAIGGRTTSSLLLSIDNSSESTISTSQEEEGGDHSPSCHVVIEYCTGCRWMLKSFWYAQELLTTFSKTNGLDAVTILPSTTDKTGTFVIRLNGEVLWDRHAMSGFPQPKEIKQQIRDVIDPTKYLGHSDTEDRKKTIIEKMNETIDLSKPMSSSGPDEERSFTSTLVDLDPQYTPSPTVTITYCTGCQWLLRAAYLGQELLTTFVGHDDDDDSNGMIKSITLIPSRPPAKGGQFVSLILIFGLVCWLADLLGRR
jgi:selenoprotein W-related protein